jgi:DNA-binding transcriptional ArsR family regulator
MEKTPQKPVSEITRLLHYFDNDSKEFAVFKNKVIKVHAGTDVIILAQGDVSLIDKNTRRVIGVIPAPMILGLASLLGPYGDFIIRCHDGAVLKSISVPESLAIVERDGLWKEVACVITYNLHAINLLYGMLASNNTCHIINKIILFIFDKQKKENKKILIAKFITERTGLSRSSVMQKLTALKKGGHVKIENGFLVEVLNLPEKY